MSGFMRGILHRKGGHGRFFAGVKSQTPVGGWLSIFAKAYSGLFYGRGVEPTVQGLLSDGSLDSPEAPR